MVILGRQCLRGTEVASRSAFVEVDVSARGASLFLESGGGATKPQIIAIKLDICLQKVFDLAGTSRRFDLLVSGQCPPNVFELPQPFGLFAIRGRALRDGGAAVAACP